MKSVVLFFASFVLFALNVQAQCPPNQAKVKVVLLTDTYPQETNWTIKDAAGTIILQSSGLAASTQYMDSVCIDTGACYTFRITDASGDGICCGYGNGHFYVYYNNVLVKADSSFGSTSSISFGCPVGNNCSSATNISQGTFTAPGPNSWYAFVAPFSGLYTVSTCLPGNSCNTKLYIYDYCNNLNYDTSNLATIYYANDNCNGQYETVEAYMMQGHEYYIRIGQVGTSCADDSIHWSINANPAAPGCLDTAACNFNPFATISDPGSCIYYPSPLCPMGADLAVDSGIMASTIYMDALNSTDVCSIAEGCVNGYGNRDVIRFSTHIANIGATDFYAGQPPASQTAYSPIYHWDPCHGHWHFTDYAQYLLADQYNNFLPIGYKNGFCVLDLMCYTGFAKFGCNNMGITSGCADEYYYGLNCQWIDVTDVPDGEYKLIVRVNFRPRPDFYGRYESNYFNNWAHTCIQVGHNSSNVRTVTVLPNCTPYYDCMGVENGLSVPDCDGNCNGTRLTGDRNLDDQRNNIDVSDYLIGSIDHTIAASRCNDLNFDQKINVIDAALLFDCATYGPNSGTPLGQTHEPCVFPDLVRNPNDHASFSIANLDTANKTFDIQILNPDCKVLGYQLKLKGVTLAANTMQNLVSGFTPEMYSRPSGEVIALTTDQMPVPKFMATAPLLRLTYTSIDSPHICIDSVVAVVNDAYEQILNANSVDSICITAPVTAPTSVAVNKAEISHKLFPNPFNKSTSLVIMDPSKDMYTVTLYDVLGKAVRTYPKSNNSAFGIERGTLASGIYYVEVRSAHWLFKDKLTIE